MLKDIGYTQAIPEPGTMMLLGLAGALLVGLRRFRIC